MSLKNDKDRSIRHYILIHMLEIRRRAFFAWSRHQNDTGHSPAKQHGLLNIKFTSDQHYCVYWNKCSVQKVSASDCKRKTILLTMYPNSILDIFAWMMDHRPQRKCDANAYLQFKTKRMKKTGLWWFCYNC